MGVLLQVHGVQGLSGGTTSQLLTSISVKFRIELLSSRWPHMYSVLTQIRACSRTRTSHRWISWRRQPRLSPFVPLFEDQGAAYPPCSGKALSAPTAHIHPVHFLSANWMVNDGACFSRKHSWPSHFLRPGLYTVAEFRSAVCHDRWVKLTTAIPLGFPAVSLLAARESPGPDADVFIHGHFVSPQPAVSMEWYSLLHLQQQSTCPRL